MNDRETRFEILKCLKNSYDKDPHSSTSRDLLLNDLNIDPNELDRNIKYLNDKYLVEAKWFLGGDFIAKITSYGIDEIEIYEEYSKKDIKVTTTSKKNKILSLISYFSNRIVEGLIITVLGGIIVGLILMKLA